MVNLYKALLENISDGILMLDENKIVTFYNKSTTDILGIDDELKGKSIDAIKDQLIFEDAKKAFDHLINNLSHKSYRKLFIVKKQNLSFTIEFRSQNMLEVEGVNAIVIIIKEEPIEYDYYKTFEESQERIWLQNEALKEIAKSSFWFTSNLNECYEAMTRIASERLKVGRASIWIFKDGYSTCEKLLDKYSCILSPLRIKLADFPNYFDVLKKTEVIDADDAFKDKRTKEFAENYLIPLGITSLLDAPIHLEGETIGYLSLEHIGPARKWHIEEKTFATSLADMVALTIASSDRKLAREKLEIKVEEQEKTLDLFKKYVPATVLTKILNAESTDSIFEGELRSASVLFCDLRNFTRISENISPKDVVSLLNAYYRTMSTSIKKHKGVINQFVGDEIFAAFGIPISYPNNEENAVLCALDMVESLAKLNEYFMETTGRTIELGIGINSGMVIAGNLGSDEKIEYSITGDTVNTGKRIEQLTKDSPNKIFISKSTFDKIRHTINVKELNPVRVQGKSAPLNIYEVVGKKQI